MAQGISRKNSLALERELQMLRERERKFVLLGLTEERLRCIEHNSLVWRFSRALINSCSIVGKALAGTSQEEKGQPVL